MTDTTAFGEAHIDQPALTKLATEELLAAADKVRELADKVRVYGNAGRLASNRLLTLRQEVLFAVASFLSQQALEK